MKAAGIVAGRGVAKSKAATRNIGSTTRSSIPKIGCRFTCHTSPPFRGAWPFDEPSRAETLGWLIRLTGGEGSLCMRRLSARIADAKLASTRQRPRRFSEHVVLDEAEEVRRTCRFATCFSGYPAPGKRPHFVNSGGVVISQGRPWRFIGRRPPA